MLKEIAKRAEKRLELSAKETTNPLADITTKDRIIILNPYMYVESKGTLTSKPAKLGNEFSEYLVLKVEKVVSKKDGTILIKTKKGDFTSLSAKEILGVCHKSAFKLPEKFPLVDLPAYIDVDRPYFKAIKKYLNKDISKAQADINKRIAKAQEAKGKKEKSLVKTILDNKKSIAKNLVLTNVYALLMDKEYLKDPYSPKNIKTLKSIAKKDFKKSKGMGGNSASFKTLVKALSTLCEM